MSWYTPHSLFDMLAYFSFSNRGGVAEVNHYVASPWPHSIMWTRLPPCSYPFYGTCYYLFSCLPGPYCFYLVISFSITVHSTWYFRRLFTFRNTESKLSYNYVVSTWSRYSSNPFHYLKSLLSSSSVPYYLSDAYKASTFSGLLASLPPISNISLYVLWFSFSSLYVAMNMQSSIILDFGLPENQFWTGVWHWWINIFFFYDMLYM